MKRILFFIAILFATATQAQLKFTQTGNFCIIQRDGAYYGTYMLNDFSWRVSPATTSDTLNLAVRILTSAGDVLNISSIAASAVYVNGVAATGYLNLSNKMAAAFPYLGGSGGGVGSSVSVTNFPTVYPGDSTQTRRNIVVTSIASTVGVSPVGVTPVSIAGTIAASPTGAILPPNAALETGGNLATIASKLPSQGQALMAASQPVAIASNQSAVPFTTTSSSQSNVSSVAVTQSQEVATGSITTQNLVPSGTATAGSTVEILTVGANAVSIQVSGTYTGALSIQYLSESTGQTWLTLTGTQILTIISGATGSTIATGATGLFTIPTLGAWKIRITGLAAMTGSANCTLRAYQSSGLPLVGLLPGQTLATITTVTTVSTVTTLANGQTAHSATATGSPVRIGNTVAATTAATQETGLVAGEAANTLATTSGQTIIKSFGTAEVDFTFNGQMSATTTPVPFKAASGTANIRNYVTEITIATPTIGTAGALYLVDGLLTAASQTISANTLTTSTNHDLKIGDMVTIVTSTVTGLTALSSYYVLTVPSATTVTFSTTPNGSTASISGTGVSATLYRVLFQTLVNTTAMPTTHLQFITPLRGAPNVNMSLYTPVSFVTGSIYYNVHGYTSF